MRRTRSEKDSGAKSRSRSCMPPDWNMKMSAVFPDAKSASVSESSRGMLSRFTFTPFLSEISASVFSMESRTLSERTWRSNVPVSSNHRPSYCVVREWSSSGRPRAISTGTVSDNGPFEMASAEAWMLCPYITPDNFSAHSYASFVTSEVHGTSSVPVW